MTGVLPSQVRTATPTVSPRDPLFEHIPGAPSIISKLYIVPISTGVVNPHGN